MIELKNLTKTYKTSDGTVEALKNVNISVPDGAIFGIIGMSGAGKSTLVRCINMLEHPTEGAVLIDGKDMTRLNSAELRQARRKITMIFQGFNLLMQRTVLKNVCFPLELAGVPKATARARAKELLDLVGLGEKANVYPAQLSGGQQQRVAIARALATEPEVLLCDEATSALDPSTTMSILELLRDINKKLGITIIIITHQMKVVEAICGYVAILDGGTVAEIGQVGEVFSQPKTEAARRLVFPEGDTDPVVSKNSDEQFIRVVFNGGEATGAPIISNLALEKGICANISYASTRNIGDGVYGSMLLGISGGEEKVREAESYLQQYPGVLVQEVHVNV